MSFVLHFIQPPAPAHTRVWTSTTPLLASFGPARRVARVCVCVYVMDEWHSGQAHACRRSPTSLITRDAAEQVSSSTLRVNSWYFQGSIVKIVKGYAEETYTQNVRDPPSIK